MEEDERLKSVEEVENMGWLKTVIVKVVDLRVMLHWVVAGLVVEAERQTETKYPSSFLVVEQAVTLY